MPFRVPSSWMPVEMLTQPPFGGGVDDVSDHVAAGVLRVDDAVDQDVAEALGCNIRFRSGDQRSCVGIVSEVSRVRENLLVRLDGSRAERFLDGSIGDIVNNAQQKSGDEGDEHQPDRVRYEAALLFGLAHFFLPPFPNATGSVALSISGDSMLPMMIE